MAMHFDHARVVVADDTKVDVIFAREYNERAVSSALGAAPVVDAMEKAFGKGVRLTISKATPELQQKAAPSISEGVFQ